MIDMNIKVDNTQCEINGTYSQSILIYRFPGKATPGFLYGLSHGAHVGVDGKNIKDLEKGAKNRVDVNMAMHFKEAEFKSNFFSTELMRMRLRRIESKIKRQDTGSAADVVDQSLIESRDAWRDILSAEKNDSNNEYLEMHYLMTFSSDSEKALKDSIKAFKKLLRKKKGAFKFKELKKEQGSALRAAWILGSAEKLTSRYPGQIVNQDQLAAFYPYLDGSLSRPDGGVYIGHRSEDSTTVYINFTLGSDGQNMLVIGKTGKGKSYWIKGLMEGLREAGFKVYASDPDGEFKDKIEAMGGKYGKYLDLTTNNAVFVDPTVIIPAILPQLEKGRKYSRAHMKRVRENDAYRYQQAMDDTLTQMSILCDDKWDEDLSNATEFAFMQMYAEEGIDEEDESTWARTHESEKIGLRVLYDIVKMHSEGQTLSDRYKVKFVKESGRLSNLLWSYFEGGKRHLFENPVDFRVYSEYACIGYKTATDLSEASPAHIKKMARIRQNMVSTLNDRLIQRDRLLLKCFSAQIFDEFQRSGKEAETKAVAYKAMTTSRKYNSMAIIGLNDPSDIDDGIWGNATHKILFYTEKNLIQNTTANIEIAAEVVSKWMNLRQYEFVYMQTDPVTNEERADVLKMYLPEEENQLAATRGLAS